METRRSEWEEEKDFTAEKVRTMAAKKYNKPLTSGRWSNKDTKDAHILALVGLVHKLADNSKKSLEKYNREPTKGEPLYIRERSPWILEDPKRGAGNTTKYGKEYWWRK